MTISMNLSISRAFRRLPSNIGAHAIYDVLRNRPARCTFYEPPGRHGDHLQERIQRGLEWGFDKPARDIK